MKTISLESARKYTDKFSVCKHEDSTASMPYKELVIRFSVGVDGKGDVVFYVYTDKSKKNPAFSSSSIEKAVFYYNKI